MNPTSKNRLRRIWNVVEYVGFLLAVFAFLGWLIYSGWNPLQWLRDVFSILWFVAAFMSVLALMPAIGLRKQDLAQGYKWMLFAAVSALASLFMLYVTVRRCL